MLKELHFEYLPINEGSSRSNDYRENLCLHSAHEIHYACEEGNYNDVKKILDTDINSVDQRASSNRATPLMIACHHGHMSVVQLLLDKGVNINAKDPNGRTALYWACSSGCLDVAKELMDRAADLEQNVSIAVAAQFGHLEMVKWLVQKGVDVNARDNTGRTALFCACEGGHLDVVQELFQYNEGEISQKTKDTLLEAAASSGNSRLIKWLLDQGFNVTRPDGSRCMALKWACIGGDIEIAEILEQHGGRLDRESANQALRTTAGFGDLEMVKWLITKGADVNAQKPFESSALNKACHEGHIDTVRELEKCGALLEHQEKAQLLLNACDRGHSDVAIWLIKQGADIHFQGYGGQTCLYKGCDNICIRNILMENGAFLQQDEKDSKLVEMAAQGRLETVKWLIEQGADLTSKDLNGCTPLHEACAQREINVVQEILKQRGKRYSQEGQMREIDVNDMDNQGHTALFKVCSSSSYRGIIVNVIDIAQMLVQHGADLNLGSNLPLVASAQRGYLDVVRWLIETGADVNLVGEGQISALEWACRHDHLSVVKELLKHKSKLAEGFQVRAMCSACERGHLSVVQELARHIPDFKEDIFSSAIEMALECSHTHLADWLIKQGVSLKPNRFSLMECSCRKGYLDIVLQMVHRFADLEVSDQDTAILWACNMDRTNVLQVLMSHGANPYKILLSVCIKGNRDALKYILHLGLRPDIIYEKSEDSLTPLSTAHVFGHFDVTGCTPLSIACTLGHVGVVEELVEHGADLELGYITTPLIAAATKGHLNVVRYLLQKGACITGTCHGGDTAMTVACFNRHHDVVKELLLRLDDLEQRDKQAAFDWACDGGHVQVVRDIRKDGNLEHTVLMNSFITAAQNGHVDVIRVILQDQVSIVDKNRALYWASLNGHIGIVKELIEVGTEKDTEFNESIIVAARNGHLEVVRYLKNEGASLKHKDVEWNMTALSWASLCAHYNVIVELAQSAAFYWACLRGDVELIQKLVLHGANLEQWDQAKPLIVAAKAGQLDTVRWMLQQGFEITVKDGQGLTVMSWACRLNHRDVVLEIIPHLRDMEDRDVAFAWACARRDLPILKEILDHGSFRKEWHKYIPVSHMVRKGDKGAVKWLIQNGGSVNENDQLGNTPLHVAVLMCSSQNTRENDHRQIITYLLEQGANVNANNKKGVTVLCRACEVCDDELVQELIKYGADINAGIATKPMITATRRGHRSIICYLIDQGANVNVCDENGDTPLHVTAQMLTTNLENRLHIVKYLLEHGANMNVMNKQGVTVLCLACQVATDELVQELIKSGAKIEAGISSKPIIAASRLNRLNIVRRLIDIDCDVNVEDSCGYTAFYRACESGGMEIVRELARKGVDMEHGNVENPLIMAARTGHHKIVKYLITKGVNVRVKDKLLGGSAMCWAVHNNHRNVIVELMNKLEKLEDRDKNIALYWACKEGFFDVLYKLVRNGADLEKGDYIQPLSLAASRGHLKIVQWMIDQGVSVNSKDMNGHTALCLACWTGFLHVVKELINLGADVNLGVTYKPIIAATRAGHLAVIKYLYTKGAQINAVDKRERTALYYACEQGNRAIMDELVAMGAILSEERKEELLITVASRGYTDIVKWLIKKGITNINATDTHGHTALWHVKKKFQESGNALGKSTFYTLRQILTGYGATI